MKPRYRRAFLEAILVGLFLVFESPMLLPLVFGWLLAGLVYLGSRLVAAASGKSVYRVALRTDRRVDPHLSPGCRGRRLCPRPRLAQTDAERRVRHGLRVVLWYQCTGHRDPVGRTCSGPGGIRANHHSGCAHRQSLGAGVHCRQRGCCGLGFESAASELCVQPVICHHRWRRAGRADSSRPGRVGKRGANGRRSGRGAEEGLGRRTRSGRRPSPRAASRDRAA